MVLGPILATLAMASIAASPAQASSCPTGSFPWTDSWGNKICKRHLDGSVATTQAPRGQACPTGSYPWTDNWGNKICRTHDAGDKPRTDYYDTSKGCPVGTHNWVDEWGKQGLQAALKP